MVGTWSTYFPYNVLFCFLAALGKAVVPDPVHCRGSRPLPGFSVWRVSSRYGPGCFLARGVLRVALGAAVCWASSLGFRIRPFLYGLFSENLHSQTHSLHLEQDTREGWPFQCHSNDFSSKAMDSTGEHFRGARGTLRSWEEVSLPQVLSAIHWPWRTYTRRNYSLGIEQYTRDPAEKDCVFNAVQTFPAVREKALHADFPLSSTGRAAGHQPRYCRGLVVSRSSST